MHQKDITNINSQRLYVWTKMRFITQLQAAGLPVQQIAAELNARGQHAIDRTAWDADAVTELVSLAQKIHQHDLRQGIDGPFLSPAGPSVELNPTGLADAPKSMSARTSVFLRTIEWSWSPVHMRRESYYLQPYRRRQWILWYQYYDDNWMEWQEPIPVARCPQKKLGPGHASMVLLAAVLADNLRRYDPQVDRLQMITDDDGALSEEGIEVVADAVWGKQPDVFEGFTCS